MMKHPLHILIYGAVIAAASATAATAQFPVNARALGMGGAYTAVARGQDALFLNPANLGLADGPRWSLALPSFSLGGTTTGPRFEDFARLAEGAFSGGGKAYDEYGEYVDDYDGEETESESSAEIQELLGLIPEQGMELDVDVRLPLAALQAGGLAVGVSYGAVVQQTLGRDAVDLLLNGYEEGRTNYRVGGATGRRATFLDFAAAYGHNFGPVSLGITGHYLKGRSLARSSLSEARFFRGENQVEIDFSEALVRGGSGFSVDVGAAMQPSKRVTLSAAVTNAIGKLSWSDQVTLRKVTLNEDDISDLSLVGDRFAESEIAAAGKEPVMFGLYETGVLPTTLRTGVALAPWSGLRIGAGYNRNLTDGRLGGLWDQSASFGAQQRLVFLSVRGGYATNFNGATMLSAGASVLGLDLGVAKLAGAQDGSDRDGWIVTLGSSIRGPLRR